MKRLIKVQYRRRRENKTDYTARKSLLEGKRFVVRKTNRYIIAQFVEHKEAQDRTICLTNSKELSKYGLKETYSMKNLQAAYLTGYLCGIKALKHNIKNAVLDIGLLRSTKGSRIYSALKGAVDAGVNIPHSKEIIPTEKMLNLKEIEAIKKKIQEHK